MSRKKSKQRPEGFRAFIGGGANLRDAVHPASVLIDDRASELDAAWFAAHPTARARERAPVPGEFAWAAPPGYAVGSVFVFDCGDGLRLRGPSFRRLRPREIQ